MITLIRTISVVFILIGFNSRYISVRIFPVYDASIIKPFYISFVSVILNILISIYYFKSVGFIIIPIATSISSWFNSIVLFIFLKKENLFYFNSIFIKRFVRIMVAAIIMGLLFKFLINFFESDLAHEQNFKSIYLMGTVLLCLISYLLIAVLIKAFKIGDIKLRY